VCNRCETHASLPLDAIRRPRDTAIWKLEGAEMPIMLAATIRDTAVISDRASRSRR
jgi:hypothetical protein